VSRASNREGQKHLDEVVSVMRNGILVLNAGSSSVKFVLFVEDGSDLAPRVRGQIEGINTAPHFLARTAEGAMIAEKDWGDGVALGHDGAVAHLADFLRSHVKDVALEAVGHRVVHGGREHTQPVMIDRDVLHALERLIPLAPLHQPHNLAPIERLLAR